MNQSDRKDFALLIAGVYAYHRQPCSDALIAMYWNGCQRWDIEQIRKAINELTNDAEAGRFPPKIADLTRALEGTKTDRAVLAWGKALDAAGRVGAYCDVAFDDAAIHAAIEDLGGWPKLCRCEYEELGYLQHRFCESYRAYVGRGTFDYPARLTGARDSDEVFRKHGLPIPKATLIGNRDACIQVIERGGVAKAITAGNPAALAVDVLRTAA